jgi:hypothetical protein
MTDVTQMSAAERLRAFEDQILPGAPRINGQIEDGIGSAFSSLPETDQVHHRALCSLIVAEHLVAMAAAEHARLDGACKAAAAKVSVTARHVIITTTQVTEEA